MKRTIRANAKINLYLNVGEKRADGYHEIDTVMQEISLYDEISVELTVNGCVNDCENEITLSSNNPRLPLNEKNIAYKCADKFLAHTGLTGLKIHIGIEKHIPVSGGLAGGSTDGAAVLKLLNSMTKADLSTEELCAIGAKVGADIPFCIVGGCCLCRGIGEKLTKLNVSVPKYYVLVVPSGHGVSTPRAYAMLDEAPHKAPCTFEDIMPDILSGEIPSVLYNSFENVILPIRPAAHSIKEKLISLGADGVMMSGSGPTIFALFKDKSKLDKTKSLLRAEGLNSYSCFAIQS